MASNWLFQMSLPGSSLLPEDVVENTFVVRNPNTDWPITALLVGVVEEFWNDAVTFDGATGDIGSRISPLVSRAQAATLKAYDLADPEPRVPVLNETFSLPSAGSANSLPREVCLCTSYHAEYESGEPAARRRGRMFIGPLDTAQLDASTGRPTASVRKILAGVTKRMNESWSALELWFSVFSRADAEARPVVGGWVDDEFDTQRRRQLRPNVRSSW